MTQNIASNFQLHAVDTQSKPDFRKTLSRGEMLSFFTKLAPCLIGIEACAGSHYWARELTKLGHDARLMAAQFANPYRKSGKNDANDAEVPARANLILFTIIGHWLRFAKTGFKKLPNEYADAQAVLLLS